MQVNKAILLCLDHALFNACGMNNVSLFWDSEPIRLLKTQGSLGEYKLIFGITMDLPWIMSAAILLDDPQIVTRKKMVKIPLQIHSLRQRIHDTFNHVTAQCNIW